MPRVPPPGRKFTTETAREAQKLSAESRRKAARSVRERLADKAQEEADAIYQAFSDAFRAGDWRAADAVLTQAFGRPVQELELQAQLDSTVQIVVQSCFEIEEPADPPVLAEAPKALEKAEVT